MSNAYRSIPQVEGTVVPDTSQDEIIARAFASSYEGQGYSYRDRRPSDCASIPPVIAEPAYDYGTWQSPSLARDRQVIVREDPADFWVFMVCCILW